MQPEVLSGIDYDVTIVGGGMVGATLACSLSGQGLKIALIEQVLFNEPQQPSYDDRGITLSASSQRIFQALGLWDKISQFANPIEQIHVSEQSSFTVVRLHASDVKQAQLAFVIPAKLLGQCLLEQVAQAEDIDYFCPAELLNFKNDNVSTQIHLKYEEKEIEFVTSLLVASDGSFSSIREQEGLDTYIKDYGQTAIVCNITTQKKNNNTAFERFTSHGPLAILPLSSHNSVCVYTVARNDSAFYMQCDEEIYKEQLIKEFGRRLGNIEKIGQRRSYPLRLIECKEQVKPGLIILGNAAHTIHPNAAQGLNLALRDVAGLAECIIKAKKNNEPLGSDVTLKRYLEIRVDDQNNIIRFTDSIAEWFYNESVMKKFARRLAMTALEKVPFIKREFIKQGMGVANKQPKLVRGLSL